MSPKTLCLLLFSVFGLANSISLVQFNGDLISTLNNNATECERHFNEVVSGVKNLELWALQMLDATSKIPEGLLKGHLMDFGQFEECMGVRKETPVGLIEGKHCLASVNLKNINFSTVFPGEEFDLLQNAIRAKWSACVPNSCRADELNKLAAKVGDLINIKLPLNFTDEFCQSKSSQPELDTGAVAVISVFAIIAAILICSTVYDVFLIYTSKKPAHEILTSFSVYTNTIKLMSTTSSASQISCLHGIRTLSMMWVIIGHTFLVGTRAATLNFLDVYNYFLKTESMFILGATVSVDSFFLMGGLVLAYVFLGTLDKGEKFRLWVFYLHRYIRLTPLLLSVILINAFLLKYFGSAPLYTFLVAPEIEKCQTYWWSALLYVQNYVNCDKQCIGVSWYLNVDMQLYILSPLILLPLRKHPKLTILAIYWLIFLVSTLNFVLAWVLEFPVFTLSAQLGLIFPDSNRYYYFTTHSRGIPWLIGIILGYYVYTYKKTKKTVKINNWLALILWIISLAVLSVCVFGGHNLMFDDYTKAIHTMYYTFNRTAWTLALTWVIFACIFGYSGPINAFLSHPFFQVASKFTYSMYIIHLSVIVVFFSSQNTPYYFSNFYMLFNFWGIFVLTLGISFLLTLTFESPIIKIEKFIFGKKQETSSQDQGIRK